MYGLPANTIGFFVISIATLVLGVRSIRHYQRRKLRLTLHFGISGIAAALGLGFQSVPFFFTRDPDVLTAMILIGRVFIDFVSFYQIFLVWYLTKLHDISIWYLVVPLLPVALYSNFVQSSYFLSEKVRVIDNKATLDFVDASIYVRVFFLLIILLAGLVLFKFALNQNSARNKVRIMSIALLYIAASMSSIYNFIATGSQSDAGVSLFGYLIAGGVFLLTILLLPARSVKT